jgi:hypothetical protein
MLYVSKPLFPLMNWNWTPTVTKPVHIYHSKLWEENTKDCFYEIFHNVIIPIHEVLYGNPPPRISEQIMGNIGATGILKRISHTSDFLVVMHILVL